MLLFFLINSLSADTDDVCPIYTDCESCTFHYADRNCGWCTTEQKCIRYSNSSQCNGTFYHGSDTKCGEKTPTPTPTPFPRFEINETLCRLYDDTYCGQCVRASTNTTTCVWCPSTRECREGDENGVFFNSYTCPGHITTDDDTCKGIYSKKKILAIRVGVGVTVGVLFILSIVFAIYVVLKKDRYQGYIPT